MICSPLIDLFRTSSGCPVSHHHQLRHPESPCRKGEVFAMFSQSATGRHRPPARTLITALLGASALMSTSAFAQPSPSQNATVNLIRALVKKGVLGQAEADTMITQAEAKAGQARATAEAAQAATRSAEPTTERQT